MARILNPERLDRVRSDALPGKAVYPDEGCEVAPWCLECPLPVCRYDAAGGLTRLRVERRNAEIRRLRSGGLSGPEVARRVGVSLRTVQRALAEER